MPQTPENGRAGSRWLWLIAIGFLLTLFLIVVRPGPRKNPAGTPVADPATPSVPLATTHPAPEVRIKGTPPHSSPIPTRTAEEIVAEKISQFARSRQEIVTAMAKQFNVTVPEDVNRLFAAVEAGRWEETTNLFASLQRLRQSNDPAPGLESLWPAIKETMGVAACAHDWPAQKLLDYGNAVLGSLRPGMVYLGGTDAGRFIPTLLAASGQGEGHIVLTQNALAEPAYQAYLAFLYGDRMNTLTADDRQRASDAYLADAQQRLRHDEQYPNEPPQLRPGENVHLADGRVQVSGPVADMLLLDVLLQTLLQKNPGLSFALEESFPMKSTYASAAPLGPIMELRAQAGPDALTPDTAAQSLDYWRSTTQALLADPDATASTAVRHAYTKLILGQANLFLDHNLTSEAEQAYQLANGLNPSDPGAVFNYINLLLKQKRFQEARQIAQTVVNLAPDDKQFRALFDSLRRLK